ncbi:hypothetical protein Pmani_039737 [Petrolisthes manimaculis]|uniref:Uncharacterized protein n=1 Tax=Petrolisthes manimaculis TaxID=1843537 RepID=A0AAE1ND46_9EUCA|nr:hypothetical protein Pmani_039737 [Petrolisthes manimaculis]
MVWKHTRHTNTPPRKHNWNITEFDTGPSLKLTLEHYWNITETNTGTSLKLTLEHHWNITETDTGISLETSLERHWYSHWKRHWNCGVIHECLERKDPQSIYSSEPQCLGV